MRRPFGASFKNALGWLHGLRRKIFYGHVVTNVAKIKFLQQHPYLTALRADIKTMWEVIKSVAPIKYFVTTTGKTRRKPFNGRAKWDIYFRLERRVLEEVKSYMTEIDSKYFLEHDGFTSQKKIDPQDLGYWIQAGTDFKLKLSEK